MLFNHLLNPYIAILMSLFVFSYIRYPFIFIDSIYLLSFYIFFFLQHINHSYFKISNIPISGFLLDTYIFCFSFFVFSYLFMSLCLQICLKKQQQQQENQVPDIALQTENFRLLTMLLSSKINVHFLLAII